MQWNEQLISKGDMGIFKTKLQEEDEFTEQLNTFDYGVPRNNNACNKFIIKFFCEFVIYYSKYRNVKYNSLTC